MTRVLGSLTEPPIILVVEDDPHARELYVTALHGGGYRVVAVEDGVDALRYLETHTPAAVVLDLGLPRLHGLDVCREMSAQGLAARVPVIVVTGETTAFDARAMFRVLHKPINPDRLLSAVSAATDGGTWPGAIETRYIRAQRSSGLRPYGAGRAIAPDHERGVKTRDRRRTRQDPTDR